MIRIECILMNKFVRFFDLKLEYKLLLTEAVLMLGISRILLLTLEFKKIPQHLGEHMKESPNELTESHFSKVKKVSWAVNIMSGHTFWQSKCLAQAMTAKVMLNRRNIKSTLYLGVAKDDEGKMIAHAWVKSCGVTLTGAKGMERFTVVSVFGD